MHVWVVCQSHSAAFHDPEKEDVEKINEFYDR